MGPLRPVRRGRRSTHRAARLGGRGGRRGVPGALLREGRRAGPRARGCDRRRERIESIFTRAIYATSGSPRTWPIPPAEHFSRASPRRVRRSTRILFFGLELADLDDAAADALLADAALERWRHWLRSVRKFRPYILTEPEERSSRRSPSWGSAPGIDSSTSWSERSSRSRRHGDRLRGGDGEALLRATDGRRRASEAVTASLEPGLRTRAFIFNTIVLDKSVDDRLRGYETWLSAQPAERHDRRSRAGAHRCDRCPVRRRPTLLPLEGAALGLDRLSHYDRMAPIGVDPTKTSWADARQIVLEAYHDFSGDVGRSSSASSARAGSMRRCARTSAQEPSARRTSDVHPYVFMNFTGERRSILTLAHELGHGLHGSRPAVGPVQRGHAVDDGREPPPYSVRR